MISAWATWATFSLQFLAAENPAAAARVAWDAIAPTVNAIALADDDDDRPARREAKDDDGVDKEKKKEAKQRARRGRPGKADREGRGPKDDRAHRQRGPRSREHARGEFGRGERLGPPAFARRGMGRPPFGDFSQGFGGPRRPFGPPGFAMHRGHGPGSRHYGGAWAHHGGPHRGFAMHRGHFGRGFGPHRGHHGPAFAHRGPHQHAHRHHGHDGGRHFAMHRHGHHELARGMHARHESIGRDHGPRFASMDFGRRDEVRRPAEARRDRGPQQGTTARGPQGPRGPFGFGMARGLGAGGERPDAKFIAEAIFRRMDRDGDQSISMAEFVQAHERRFAGPAGQARPDRGPPDEREDRAGPRRRGPQDEGRRDDHRNDRPRGDGPRGERDRD